ncbi:hypothetical protein B0H14DRAFT_2597169 [Mycena olivaceomarginata]|nr:hypothetical protein B0H14DRAFT_2597169 [Mycena olivaceomarginata]
MQKASATSKENGRTSQALTYATIAADILRDLAQASHIPFLQNAAAAISCVLGEINVRVWNENEPGNALASWNSYTSLHVPSFIYAWWNKVFCPSKYWIAWAVKYRTEPPWTNLVELELDATAHQELVALLALKTMETRQNIQIHSKGATGPGGMGKTTLAVAALHHPEIVLKYVQRHFISCESASENSRLVKIIATHLGLEPSKHLSTAIIAHFRNCGTTLLVLDNLETVWEEVESRAEVEDLLSLLSDAGTNIVIAYHYAGCRKTCEIKVDSPVPSSMEPLHPSASRQTFIEIADLPPSEEESALEELLALSGNLPLAVQAIIYLQPAHALLPKCQKSSHPAIISADGLSEVDMLSRDAGHPNILKCREALVRTSLAYMDQGRLKALTPIRQYMKSERARWPSMWLIISIRAVIEDYTGNIYVTVWICGLLRLEPAQVEVLIEHGVQFYKQEGDSSARDDFYKFAARRKLKAKHSGTARGGQIDSRTSAAAVSHTPSRGNGLQRESNIVLDHSPTAPASDLCKTGSRYFGDLRARELVAEVNMLDIEARGLYEGVARMTRPRIGHPCFHTKLVTQHGQDRPDGGEGTKRMSSTGWQSPSQAVVRLDWKQGMLFYERLMAGVHLARGGHCGRTRGIHLMLTIQSGGCLEMLGDLRHGMSDVETTFHWAGTFFAAVRVWPDVVLTYQALRCLGDIFLAEGDDETALNVFSAVLEGATEMDVHRRRADCMVRIGDILMARGNAAEATKMWRDARPLFIRSSQMKDAASVDVRLAQFVDV